MESSEWLVRPDEPGDAAEPGNWLPAGSETSERLAVFFERSQLVETRVREVERQVEQIGERVRALQADE